MNNTWKTILSFAILLLCLSGCRETIAAIYWVSPNGAAVWANCQGTAPLSGTSACSLATANANAVAGDTVCIRKGTYVITGDAINPLNSGTPGQYITYSNYNNEDVEFVGGASTCMAINLNHDAAESDTTPRNYIRVTGSAGHLMKFAKFYRGLHLHNGNYNEIAYVAIIGNYERADGLIFWAFNSIAKNSQFNHIHHCVFGENGSYIYLGDYNDHGVVLDVGTEDDATGDTTYYNIIENNHLYHGGHHVLGLFGGKNVFRGNYIHNEKWWPKSNPTYGDRVVEWSQLSTREGRTIFEGNRIGYGGATSEVDQVSGGGGFINSHDHIIRYNDFFGNDMYALKLQMYANTSPSRNHIYNNTSYRNGHAPAATKAKNAWLNTYSHSFVLGAVGGCSTTEAQLAAYYSGNVFKNNLMWDNANYYGDTLGIVWTNYPGCQPALTGLHNTIAPNFTETADPLFTNTNMGDKTSTTLPDLSLTSASPAINQGAHLTQATNAGPASTKLVVADSLYFQDGNFGTGTTLVWPSSASMAADWIAVGSVSNVVQIKAINYSTHTITLATPATWANNAPVWLYKKSDGAQVLSGTAPDYGAHEHVSGGADTTPPAAPSGLKVD